MEQTRAARAGWRVCRESVRSRRDAATSLTKRMETSAQANRTFQNSCSVLYTARGRTGIGRMGGEDSGIRVARYRPGPDVGVGDNGSRVDRAVVFGLVSR